MTILSYVRREAGLTIHLNRARQLNNEKFTRVAKVEKHDALPMDGKVAGLTPINET